MCHYFHVPTLILLAFSTLLIFPKLYMSITNLEIEKECNKIYYFKQKVKNKTTAILRLIARFKIIMTKLKKGRSF